MTYSLKQIAMLAVSVVALGACSDSGSGENTKPETTIETHNNDDITKLRARVIKIKGETKTELGVIRFTEKDSGLVMRVEISGVKPNNDYSLWLYDISKCDMKKYKADKTTAKCEKERSNITLPILHADAEGRVNMSFLMAGLTAAEMENMKIAIGKKDGKKIGWGVLKERSWF
ncbi:MAG: hypothetical protein LBB23_03220 [Rickettsiales bacterium]|jgi:Cu/Zn superoxide dismutase|nr:hypothetical protein [Rickettsiales bacterium]